MLLLLRGHIRNSFENESLYILVKKISETVSDLKIYIHTWDIFANNISWRQVEENNNVVTRETIHNYFKELSKFIKEIIIDSDKNIKLYGNTRGNIGTGPMPLIGWKNYWYGKYRLINYASIINKNDEEYAVNCRFDIFNNSNSFTLEQIYNFIIFNMNNKFDKLVFPYNREAYGIDNIYIGNIRLMRLLTKKFHHSLDEILERFPLIRNQEFLVFQINNELFS